MQNASENIKVHFDDMLSFLLNRPIPINSATIMITRAKLAIYTKNIIIETKQKMGEVGYDLANEVFDNISK